MTCLFSWYFLGCSKLDTCHSIFRRSPGCKIRFLKIGFILISGIRMRCINTKWILQNSNKSRILKSVWGHPVLVQCVFFLTHPLTWVTEFSFIPQRLILWNYWVRLLTAWHSYSGLMEHHFFQRIAISQHSSLLNLTYGLTLWQQMWGSEYDKNIFSLHLHRRNLFKGV